MRAALFATALAALLAGCGETPQHYQYQEGRYAGKPDTPPWNHDRFEHSREQWHEQIKTRNWKQSEYTRIRGGG